MDGNRPNDNSKSESGSEDSTEEILIVMQERVAEMEKEAMDHSGSQAGRPEQGEISDPGDTKANIDRRSIFVRNVHYHASPEDVRNHFQNCGIINRVTIPLDKLTRQFKGYAFVEFASPDIAAEALRLNHSVLKDRQIHVLPKRTNIPGIRRSGARGYRPKRGCYERGPRYPYRYRRHYHNFQHYPY